VSESCVQNRFRESNLSVLSVLSVQQSRIYVARCVIQLVEPQPEDLSTLEFRFGYYQTTHSISDYRLLPIHSRITLSIPFLYASYTFPTQDYKTTSSSPSSEVQNFLKLPFYFADLRSYVRTSLMLAHSFTKHSLLRNPRLLPFKDQQFVSPAAAQNCEVYDLSSLIHGLDTSYHPFADQR
jgi:hypothetical protein